MTPLYCPIYISTDRQNCSISPELAQHLVAPAKARNGDVVAICHEYHSTEAHFGREVVTYFVVHMDGALQFRSYCGLEASQQAPMAHLEMLLQEEPSIPIIVQMQVEGDGRMEGMQKASRSPKATAFTICQVRLGSSRRTATGATSPGRRTIWTN